MFALKGRGLFRIYYLLISLPVVVGFFLLIIPHKLGASPSYIMLSFDKELDVSTRIQIRSSGKIVKETTLNKIPNDTELSIIGHHTTMSKTHTANNR